MRVGRARRPWTARGSRGRVSRAALDEADLLRAPARRVSKGPRKLESEDLDAPCARRSCAEPCPRCGSPPSRSHTPCIILPRTSSCSGLRAYLVRSLARSRSCAPRALAPSSPSSRAAEGRGGGATRGDLGGGPKRASPSARWAYADAAKASEGRSRVGLSVSAGGRGRRWVERREKGAERVEVGEGGPGSLVGVSWAGESVQGCVVVVAGAVVLARGRGACACGAPGRGGEAMGGCGRCCGGGGAESAVQAVQRALARSSCACEAVEEERESERARARRRRGPGLRGSTEPTRRERTLPLEQRDSELCTARAQSSSISRSLQPPASSSPTSSSLSRLLSLSPRPSVSPRPRSEAEDDVAGWVLTDARIETRGGQGRGAARGIHARRREGERGGRGRGRAVGEQAHRSTRLVADADQVIGEVLRGACDEGSGSATPARRSSTGPGGGGAPRRSWSPRRARSGARTRRRALPASS